MYALQEIMGRFRALRLSADTAGTVDLPGAVRPTGRGGEVLGSVDFEDDVACGLRSRETSCARFVLPAA